MSTPDLDPTETAEWHDALKAVQQHRGPARASHLLYAVERDFRSTHRTDKPR